MKDNQRKIQQYRIISNQMVAKDYFVMDLEAPFLRQHVLAGNFVAIRVQEEVTDPFLRIPLGVHKKDEKGISVLYKVVGKGTRLLSKKVLGEKINIMGPLGNNFDLEGLSSGESVILASGGHGIAPLYLLAEEIKKRDPGIKIQFLIGACTKEEILCSEELKTMGCEVRIATDDGSQGRKGYVTDLIRDLLVEKKRDCPSRLFACGPRAMLAAVSKIAELAEISTQVSLDAYMACGIGACLGCAVKTTRGYEMVCKDGPVFMSDEVDWTEASGINSSCVCG